MNLTKLSFRPWNTPADYGRIAEIYSSAFWSPTTAAALVAADDAFPAKGERHRLVCTDPSGLIVGYGTLFREGHEEPGRYDVRVVIDEQHRRQGVGAMLLAELERLAGERGATRLDTQFRDDPPFLEFARQHGYRIHERQLGWSLDLGGFDEAPFVHVLTRLEAEGLRFVTLADNDPQLTAEALYELERHANHDEPGFENEPFELYEQWYAAAYESETRPLDMTVVAMDDARPVALSAISLTPAGNGHISFTGVHREYRGRGLAQAVKLLAIRAARRHGAGHLGTGNSERNYALLHVNAKLGFVRRPGKYWCIKHLGDMTDR